jgi:hypothetical protein
MPDLLQVGVKRLTMIRFRQHMDLSKSIAEREDERRRKRRVAAAAAPSAQEELTDWTDYPSVSSKFDPVDVVFDFPGRVVGLATSADSRYIEPYMDLG